EDHARLDLRVLAKKGYCRSGERRLGAIDWSDTNPSIDALRFLIDLTDPLQPHAELEMMQWGMPSYQTVRLIDRGANGRTRWCFVCPVTGEAVEVLAYRASRFASPKAQRLVNRSQIK
ncbi:MAG: hypothetical protein ACYDD1_18635, partial [Caulobacteraceae bacterium]